MAKFYNGNNRKMMMYDSFSTSHEEISYMKELLTTPNPVSYDGETKPKVSAVGRNQQFPQSNSANSAIGKKLSIVHCTLLIVFCLLFGGNAWGQSYPTVSFGSGCEPICRVVFNTIDKSSDCTTSASVYEDYTTTTTTVVAGNSYSITVYGNTDGSYTNYIKVFFDFNRDYDFDDSGESFEIGTIYNCSSCSVSGTITIPSSVTSGNVRMRVVKNYNSYGTSSGGGFGQAEDYTVVVQPLQPPAPDASVPYSCNFENTTENGNWRFGNATDGWYIGSATYNSSSKSLYVSANGGTSNSYNNTYQYIYAYRTLNFSSTGTYNVSYNWKALAETCCDYLRGFLVPATSNPNLVAGQSNGIVQTGAPSGWMAIDGGNKLNGQSSWQVYSGNVTISTAGTYYLVFYWYSDQSNQGGSYNPPAAVDNIEITPYAAEITSINCNTTNWCIGETRTVTLQVKNTGSVTWKTSATGGNTECSTMNNIVAVSYKWDEDEWYDSHPNSRIEFSADVAPNGTATITFDVDGPRKSGTNHLSFNVIRRECKWLNPTGTTSVEVTVPALALTASPTTLCDGGESVLSMSCGQTADFYEYEPFISDWNSNDYTTRANMTDVSVERSIIKFKSTNWDPQIEMYGIGHFNPNIYKTFRMRYRITGGSSNDMQVYHTFAGNTTATGEHQVHHGTLYPDGNWHICEIDMTTNAIWTSNGDILGWRLDPCNAENVIMEIDWIGLFPDPIATGESMLSVSPSQNTTYSACNYMVNRSCIHKATKAITVATSPTITSSPDIASTCFDGSTQVVLTAGGAANVESILINEGFENSGALPSDWTISTTGSNNWSALTAVCSGNSPYEGSYVVGTGNGTSSRSEEMYIITPAMDLSNAISATLHFYYCNKNWSSDTDPFGVYYRIGTSGSWNQLLYTSDAHTGWTEQTINLTGLAANYQIGFYRKDNFGYGAGIDNVKVTALVSPTYSWSSTGTSGSASGATYTVTPRAGSNTYTVSAGGCSRSVSIDVLTADNITASGATTDCGTPVTLTASGIDGATYNWYSDAACNTLVQENSSSYTPQNITSSQTYYVKATEDYLGGDLYEYAVRDFGYTGSVQEFVIPEGTEALKLEVWGAQSIYSSASPTTEHLYGRGGYAKGTINDLTGIYSLYVYVGGKPGSSVNGSSSYYNGGWNGGGGKPSASSYNDNGPGGGATDICLTRSDVTLSNYRYTRTSASYLSRLIVAGGGGGGRNYNNSSTDPAGGYVPGVSLTTGADNYYASMTAAGKNNSNYIAGNFGYGSSTNNTSDDYGCGGGGWYGGGSNGDSYGGGGSSFVWCDTYASYVPSGYTPTASMKMTNVEVKAGTQSFTSPYGSSETGHTGDGYARITIYKRSPIPCTSNAKSVALTVNPLSTPTVTSNSPICEGSQAQLQIQSPNNDYTYSWYSGSTNVANATSYSPTLNSGATYTVNANSTHDQILATYDFDYTGEMQEVVAPANTSYAILEVWGAEGGRSRGNSEWKANGGMGGYSKGKFATSSGQHFYVVVGGKGHDAVLGDGVIAISAIGGYNGGGGGTCDNDPASDTGREAAGAGGGATHIAKAAPSGSTNYQLRNYSSNRNDVLIVAGGGGGASWNLAGGAGGGETGGSGTTTGTIIYGGFGYGANAVGMGQNDGVGGGGGGWQGGNACSASSGGSNAGGGSGYIGGVTEGTTTGGVRSGNGHARIVFYRNGGGSCVSPDRSVTVEVKTKPINPASIACNSSTTICEGTEITLTANGGSEGTAGCTYEWGTGSNVGSNKINGQTSSSLTITPDANTTYWVRRVANSPCSYTTGGATQLITVNTAPTAPISISGSNICLGNNTELTATGGSDGDGSTYQWGTGTTVGENTISGNTSTITVTPTETTTYWVRRVGNTACVNNTDGVTKQITVNTPNPSASGTYDYIWRGGTADWNTSSNWYMYSAGNYSVASGEMPATAKNYYIGTGDCLPSGQWPSLSANATVGNVTIDGGSVTIPANKTLSIAGSVNGTLTAQDNSTIEFVGSDDQTLSDAATFGNVTIAQTVSRKKITAPNGITVNGLANFTAGIVNGNMNFGASATTANASLTSHVDGKVTKAAGSGEFTFPTGNAGVLGSVTATVITDTWVRFHNLVASGDDLPADYPRYWNPNNNCDDNETRFDHVSNFEYWDISSSAGLSNATIVASADNASKHFGSTDPAPTASDVFGAIWTGSCWKNLGGSNQDISDENRTIRVEGVVIPAVTRAGTPYFTLGSKTHETLLPIELVSFTATCDGRSSLVEWTTATEKNNDYFSLERSDDAVNFTEIARVAGAGNSIEPIDYSYTDYGIHGGDNYYRLVQVDYDGTRTASEVIVANCIEPEVGEPDVQAYPNPFCSDLTVVLDNFGNRAATIEVYDMLGKLIYTNKIAAPQNSYETILNLSNLPPAAYTVRVSTTDFVINRNVVKQ